MPTIGGRSTLAAKFIEPAYLAKARESHHLHKRYEGYCFDICVCCIRPQCTNGL
nr:hypothetical protein [Coxiella-like endosymbiont]